MTRDFSLFAELSDAALIDCVRELAARTRRVAAELVAALAELDRRKLYLPLGYSSLFAYCTRALHLSEHSAYNRIEAARASMSFPSILERLEDGSLTLSAVRLLAPVLTPDNVGRLIDAAQHQSKRDIEVLVAAERPKPDAPTIVRRLPPPPNHLERDACVPLAPERYKIQFTASAEFHARLRRAQTLLRHAVPDGDPSEILSRGLQLLLTHLEKHKAAQTVRPGAPRSATVRTRHIPAAVKREVWKRDGARCAFVGATGRCNEEAFLEYHHVVPFAEGGAATTANIELRCRAHNAYESDRVFTPMFAE